MSTITIASKTPTGRPGRITLAAIVRTLLALAVTLPMSLIVVETSQAATKTGLVMATTQRMSGPSLKTTQYGWYSKGTRITLSCYVRGQSVSGYYGGPSTLWYRVSDGRYVADIDLNTGSNAPITGACASSAATKASRAVTWAKSQVGSNSYYNLCELFVERAYGTSGRYPTALSAYKALKSRGMMHTTKTSIPAGALVFSDGPLDGPNGHVMLSVGGGQFVSGGANGPSVKYFSTPNPGSTFLGWSYAPSEWPGR